MENSEHLEHGSSSVSRDRPHVPFTLRDKVLADWTVLPSHLGYELRQHFANINYALTSYSCAYLHPHMRLG